MQTDTLPVTWGGPRRNLWAAYRFFRQHAGGIVGESAKGALQLAKAERRAAALGFRFKWEPDYDADLDDHEFWCKDAKVAEAKRKGQPVDRDRACDVHVIRGCEHSVQTCLVYEEEGDEVLASLSGIIDASTRYARVVEAELALEALANYDRAKAREKADAQLRGEARELYGDDNVTIDDDADVRRSEDGSIRVQAWLRLPSKE